jgi:hypothetical protein
LLLRFVMAGLDPAIHELSSRDKAADARGKRGQDEDVERP